jgi:hypothetical protein
MLDPMTVAKIRLCHKREKVKPILMNLMDDDMILVQYGGTFDHPFYPGSIASDDKTATDDISISEKEICL